MSNTSIEWKRLITEGTVIVVSILLAFTIDAWWDERQQTRDAADQVARVVAELRANVALLEDQDRNLGRAIEVAGDFLKLFGPEPAPTELLEIAALLEGIYSVPTFSLERSASANFLSSGQLTESQWAEFRTSLANTLSSATTAESSSLELRQMRPEIANRMQLYVSGLDLVRAHPLMKDYQPSRFTSDTHGLLSDMQFEGFISNYTIRMEINRLNVRDLLRRYQSLIADVDAADAGGSREHN